MPTHAETSKRQHSSDEESSSPTGPGYTGAAGLLTPTRPNKIPRPNNGKETMDADFGAGNAGLFTPALDGHTSTVPSGSSSELLENVETPTPRPSLPLPTHGIDPLLPLGDLDSSSGEETDTVEVKVESQDLRMSHPNSASELYDRLVAEGHTDPVKAWFEALGLPCHPYREEVLSKSTTSTNDPATIESSPIPPLNTENDSSNATGSSKDGPTGKVNGNYYTACKLEQSTLQEFCKWEFRFTHPPPETQAIDARGTYQKIYRTPTPGNERRILHIEDRPMPKPGATPRPLNWLIENHLTSEAIRMDPTVANPTAQLWIPKEWKEENAAVLEPPLFYGPPVRNPYLDSLPQGQAFLARQPTEQPLYVASDAGSPPSYADTESQGGSSDASSPPSQEEESSKAAAVGLKVSELCEAHDIDSIPEADTKKRNNVAVSFYKALNFMNLPYNKYYTKQDAIRELERFYGLPICYRRKSRKMIKREDKWRRAGDVTSQEDTDRLGDYPPHVILQFLRYSGRMDQEKTEMAIEKTVGGLLRLVVTGKDLEVSDNSPLVFPIHLRPVASSPSPDLYVRAMPGFGWPTSLKRLLPTVFAGECKRDKTVNVDKIRAQLATAFHATLIMLILYYLDTRKEVTSELPPWLFLYGLEYNEFGGNICAHYPSYKFDEEGGHWELHSKILTQKYLTVFMPDNASLRVRFLSIMYKIRSHSLFVLEQLRTWDRAEDVLGTLLKSTG